MLNARPEWVVLHIHVAFFDILEWFFAELLTNNLYSDNEGIECMMSVFHFTSQVYDLLRYNIIYMRSMPLNTTFTVQ